MRNLIMLSVSVESVEFRYSAIVIIGLYCSSFVLLGQPLINKSVYMGHFLPFLTPESFHISKMRKNRARVVGVVVLLESLCHR